jgi:transposase
LRKAIKLALLYPRRQKYPRFLDGLLGLYRDGKRVAGDGRLGAAGRRERVAELEDRLCDLCLPYQGLATADLSPPERDFCNLANELLDRLMDEELFTFVLHPEVEPTNNFTERLQRGPALERKAGRTSKTAAGAQRRSVIVSVLESLRANLEVFTLSSVLQEVQRWLAEGVSRFARQWQSLLGSTARPAADTG